MASQLLKAYQKKRNFKKTPEPVGKLNASQKKDLYLIQKHAASHLHYDFRLELNGVLKSWAIPKGPSLDPSIKRLAVHVEDHPLAYGSFEGTIPQGEYGGGTVMLWDQGTWTTKENREASYKKGHMTFTLHGKKLQGTWTLLKIKNNPKNWLLIKLPDKYARAESDGDILEEKPLSVLSQQSIDEIAKKHAKTWTSNNTVTTKSPKKNLKNPALKKLLSSFTNKKKSAQPSRINPTLATLVDQAPTGNTWLHELKFDGYRLICFSKKNSIKLLTRNHQDWTHKINSIVMALEKLKLGNTILDGELVALDEKGNIDFQTLQNTLHTNSLAPLYYYVFDIIYYDGFDLTSVPLLERKKLLSALLKSSTSDVIHYSDHTIGNGPLVFKNACKHNLEGIVSKEISSTYSQNRSQQWLKVKCNKRQEFVIGGYTAPQGTREYFGSLLLGFYATNKKFVYCGHVGTGFTQKSLAAVHKLLQKNQTSKMPFSSKPPTLKNVTWVKPKILVEVEFSQWTQEGRLRHPSFKGLRKDKSPTEVTLETPQTTKKMQIKSILTDYKFSHPERVFYPQINVTKQDLANFYLKISRYILPYIINRPLTLVRCPQGLNEACFFQKHSNETLPPGIFTKSIKEKKDHAPYLYIKDITGLMGLVQIGALEIHTWGCQINTVENPDMMVFDLDPAENVDWKEVINTAKLLKKQLALVNLQSFVKTSGGKGLHVVVPLDSSASWDKVVTFAHAFTELIVSQHPTKYLSTMSKTKRSGKIFIDYLRNNRGATTVAPYSTRAKNNAPISTPLSWQELTVRIKPDSYTIENLLGRLAKLQKDPWQDFYTIKQRLPTLG